MSATSRVIPVDASAGLALVEEEGYIVGMLQCLTEDPAEPHWRAYLGANGSERLVGDFRGAHSREIAYRRVLECHRASAFLSACLVCPSRHWNL